MISGFDARFPNQNQTKHCWQNYVDYHKCILAKGEDFAPCRQVTSFSLLVPCTTINRCCSSSWHTDHCAQVLGVKGGTTRGTAEPSQCDSTSKSLGNRKGLVRRIHGGTSIGKRNCIFKNLTVVVNSCALRTSVPRLQENRHFGTPIDMFHLRSR